MNYNGLTKAQVEEQIELGNVNSNTSNGTLTTKEILKKNVFTYFNLVFVILGILLVIAGSFKDLTFLLVIAANSAIGIIQELKAKATLDKMNLMTAQKVKTIRNGKIFLVPSHGIVLGDYLVIEGGMQVPADARILEGSIHVSESILTGESDEIEKKEESQILAGSVVISGQATVLVEAVGDETYASELTKEATTMEEGEQSEILRSLDKMLKFFGFLIIPLGIILFIQQHLHGATFQTNISSTVAALIGMIPEGIYLTTSIALAVSAARLAKEKVLVHDLKCIETLARVDVVCLDKTGTITEPEMIMKEYKLLNDSYTEEEFRRLMGEFAYSAGRQNETMEAVANFFPQHSSTVASEVTPFSSKYKYSAQTIREKHYVFGAPEYVFGDQLARFEEDVHRYADQGSRVLAFAEYTHLPKGEEIDCFDIIPIAFLIIENPIRKGAGKTFEYFKSQGVELKVISGDNPLTVSRVARAAGIEGADRYIDVSSLDDQGLEEAAADYVVFGRVKPEQKKGLVIALQNQGKQVAMTGDGVNDIIAMKQADCSVAMASGSEATAQAAQLVLLESDFSKMPSIVDEGRRVVNNIQSAASLYLVKNIFSLLLCIFSVMLGLGYPLNPSQITLISLFTIGIPSFVIALEPNREVIRGKFMQNVLLKSLPAGLTDFLVVSGLVLLCTQFGITHTHPGTVSTASSILVAIVGFMILGRIINLKKLHHLIMVVAVILGYIFCIFIFSSFFGISGITRDAVLLFIIFAIVTEPILRYLSMLSEFLSLIHI